MSINLFYIYCECTSPQKIPMRDLHATEKSGIVELALIMQTGVCPYIVEFYGCLIRDVSI